MNLVVNLILVCAAIILLPLALAMLLLCGAGMVSAARGWRGWRRMDRDIQDLLSEPTGDRP